MSSDGTTSSSVSSPLILYKPSQCVAPRLLEHRASRVAPALCVGLVTDKSIADFRHKRSVENSLKELGGSDVEMFEIAHRD